jgi:peptidoglycan-N-acetylglucosamine deacetylase
MDDIRPYPHAGGPVELPVQWLLDDAPYFWFSAGSDWTRTIAAPSHVREIWLAELDGVAGLGGCVVFTMHPQLIGRPHRLAFLDRLIADVHARGDLWIARCDEIAAEVPA